MSAVPLRQASSSTRMDDDGVPTGDPKDTSELLIQRLGAWRHAVEYLQNYIEAAEKVEKSHAKECEKLFKSISSPLKQGQHFDQSPGGIAALFENMRLNTKGMITSHLETEKNIKGSVLPILENLHNEIKSKSKELSSGASKGAKAVEKARNDTQKHIELLGQHAASFDSTGGPAHAMDDPYVIARAVHHRLNRQVLEENHNHHDLVNVQNNFGSFEGHILEIIQQTLASFNQCIVSRAQKERTLHADMLGNAQKITPSFEWNKFVQRNSAMLIDPKSTTRSVESITFPNQDHHSTKPLIAGTLERKSRNKLSMSGYTLHYYAVTPSKFLHEYKDNDDTRKDPEPEMSIYLPDATIGATNLDKFNIKGKDVSKGLSSKLSGTSEVAFKAHSATDAQKWFEVIRQAAGTSPTEPYSSRPSSPVLPHHDEQTSGFVGAEKPAHLDGAGQATTTTSPTTAAPANLGK